MEHRPQYSHVEAKHHQHRKGTELDGTRRGWRHRLDGLLGSGINPLALIAMGAFVAHQAFLAADIHLIWADSYMDPLCTVPVALGIPSIAARMIRPNFLLPWWAVVSFTAALAVAFEVWIPSFDARFTADPLDGLAYFTGAGIWRFVEPLGR